MQEKQWPDEAEVFMVWRKTSEDVWRAEVVLTDAAADRVLEHYRQVYATTAKRRYRLVPAEEGSAS